jgi:hypothetical protein
VVNGLSVMGSGAGPRTGALHSLFPLSQQLVVRAIPSPTDPRTLREWGRAVGLSVGGIRNWCYCASIKPKRALLLTRVLRAVSKYDNTSAPAHELLDIVDRRTLVKVLEASGGTATSLPESCDAFLSRQVFVACDCRRQA